MTERLDEIRKEFECRIVPPNWKDRVMEIYRFREFQRRTTESKEAIEGWWEKWANEIFWFRKWEKVLDDSNPPFYRWFVGGETNLAYLCTDWQIEQGRKNKVAIIWEGEPVNEKGEPVEIKKLTYSDLHRQSNRIAKMLREKLGVKRGDILTFYLPMIPELPLYMLAVQRIGAKHSIVFSGFSAEALAARILDARSRFVVTADGVYRRGKVLDLKGIVDEALCICEREGHSVEKVIVVRRAGNGILWYEGRDEWHHELLEEIPMNSFVECERLGADDFAFVLYTSGTTGKPKGVQHSVGGCAVHLYATMKLVHDIRENDVFWCTADVGWITGHSYVVYGPLICGTTTLMYEGAPDYPNIERWASIIERHDVSIFYTAPTAIRMLMRYSEEHYTKYDLSSLRVLNSVGEPINPEAWRWFYRLFGLEDVVFSSTWWMTETGGIITGHFPGMGSILPLKPGTNGFPIPGVKLEVLDEDGNPVKPGDRGYLVVSTPFPGMMMTIFGDQRRFKDYYFGKYREKGRFFYTGDFATVDEDGYIWVLGRADDVLKVAGHRIGAAEVESAMVRHPAVAEAACVGKSDELKGEIPVLYVVLRSGHQPSEELREELRRHLRSTIGAVVASDAIITFVNALPKTRSGKIMRRLLRAVGEGKSLGDVSTLESDVAVEEARKAYEDVKVSTETNFS